MERRASGSRAPLTPVQPVSEDVPQSRGRTPEETRQTTPERALKRALSPTFSEKTTKSKTNSIHSSKNKRVSFGGQEVKFYERHEFEWSSPPAPSPSRRQSLEPQGDHAYPGVASSSFAGRVSNTPSAYEHEPNVRAAAAKTHTGNNTLDAPSPHRDLPHLLATACPTVGSMESDDDNTIQSGSSLSEATLAQVAYGIRSYASGAADDATSSTNEDDSLQYRERFSGSSEGLSLFMDEDITKAVGHPRMSMPLTGTTSLTRSVTRTLLTGGERFGRRASLSRPPLPRPRRSSRLSTGSWRATSNVDYQGTTRGNRRDSIDDNITGKVPSLAALIDADSEETAVGDRSRERFAHETDARDNIRPSSTPGKLRYEDEPPKFPSIQEGSSSQEPSLSHHSDSGRNCANSEDTPRWRSLWSTDIRDAQLGIVANTSPTVATCVPPRKESNSPIAGSISEVQRDEESGGLTTVPETSALLEDITGQVPRLTALIDEDNEISDLHLQQVPQGNGNTQISVHRGVCRVASEQANSASRSFAADTKSPALSPDLTARDLIPQQSESPQRRVTLGSVGAPIQQSTRSMHGFDTSTSVARRRSLAASVRRLSMKASLVQTLSASKEIPLREVPSEMKANSHSKLGASPEAEPLGRVLQERYSNQIVRLERDPNETAKTVVATQSSTIGKGAPRDDKGLESSSLPASEASVASAPGNAVFKDFLYAAGVRFLDDLSTRRRITSFGVPSNRICVQPDSLEQHIRVACITVALLGAFQYSCEVLASENGKLATEIAKAEEEFRTRWLFTRLIELHLSGSEPNLLTRYQLQLKRLKNVGRLRARCEWYLWRARHEQRIQVQLRAQQENLQNDLAQLCGLAENLRATISAATEDAITSGLGQLSTDPKLVHERNLHNQNTLRHVEERDAQIQETRSRLEQLHHELNRLSEHKAQLATECLALRTRHQELQAKARLGDAASCSLMLAEQQDSFDILVSLTACRPISISNDTLCVRVGSTVDIRCSFVQEKMPSDACGSLVLNNVQACGVTPPNEATEAPILIERVAQAVVASFTAQQREHFSVMRAISGRPLWQLRWVLFAVASAVTELQALLRNISIWKRTKPYEVEYRESHDHAGLVRALFSDITKHIRVEVILKLEPASQALCGIQLRLHDIVWHLPNRCERLSASFVAIISNNLEQWARREQDVEVAPPAQHVRLAALIETTLDAVAQTLQEARHAP
jgi:hypothetical protein